MTITAAITTSLAITISGGNFIRTYSPPESPPVAVAMVEGQLHRTDDALLDRTRTWGYAEQHWVSMSPAVQERLLDGRQDFPAYRSATMVVYPVDIRARTPEPVIEIQPTAYPIRVTVQGMWWNQNRFLEFTVGSPSDITGPGGLPDGDGGSMRDLLLALEWYYRYDLGIIWLLSYMSGWYQSGGNEAVGAAAVRGFAKGMR